MKGKDVKSEGQNIENPAQDKHLRRRIEPEITKTNQWEKKKEQGRKAVKYCRGCDLRRSTPRISRTSFAVQAAWTGPRRPTRKTRLHPHQPCIFTI
jgi:hypothetical protein